MSQQLIPTRLERIRTWHSLTSAKAFETRLLIFFTGMEIKALQSQLGITQGSRSDLAATSETVSEVSNGRAKTWEELLRIEVGITDRTARNYVRFYENMVLRAPGFVEWVIKQAAPRLDGSSDVLALPNPQQVIAHIDPEALISFREASDPYTLSELYEKPLKPTQVQAEVEKAKRKAAQHDQAKQLEFWFGEVAQQIRKKDYLRFPRNHREMLLDALEAAVRELKASLKGSAQ